MYAWEQPFMEMIGDIRQDHYFISRHTGQSKKNSILINSTAATFANSPT